MQNEDQIFYEILNSKTSDDIIKECMKELEDNKIKYMELKSKLIEWQASCIRAGLAIKYIKYKGKNSTLPYKTFYKKELKNGILKPNRGSAK